MEKVTKFDLASAFKALDELEMPEIKKESLTESCHCHIKTDALLEDFYDVNSSEDMEAAKAGREEEIAQAKLDKIEKIVDLDAETSEDIQPSYVGKTIIQCPQCMTMFYKDPADVAVSEEDDSVCNVGEKCQHCGNDSGYTLIGKVAEEPVAEPEPEPVEEEPAPVEEPVAEDSEVEEDGFNLDFPEAEKDETEEPVEESLTEDADEEKLDLGEPEVNIDDIPVEEVKVAEEETEEVTFTQEETKEVAVEVAEEIGEKMEEDPSQEVSVEEVAEEKVEEKVEEKIAKELEDEEGETEEIEDEEEQEKLEDANLTGSLNEAKDEIKLEFTDVAVDDMLDSKEFETPISEKEVDGYLDECNKNKMKAFDEVEGVKEESLEKCISESLTNVYENVENFKVTDCLLDTDKFVVEGIINFKSGKSKATKYVFTEAVKDDIKLTLKGINESLSKDGEFTLTCCLEDCASKLIAESISYKYKIGDNLVEGFTK